MTRNGGPQIGACLILSDLQLHVHVGICFPHLWLHNAFNGAFSEMRCAKTCCFGRGQEQGLATKCFRPEIIFRISWLNQGRNQFLFVDLREVFKPLVFNSFWKWLFFGKVHTQSTRGGGGHSFQSKTLLNRF